MLHLAPMGKKYDPYYFKEPNLAPTGAKRQHYVPQMYLARFTEEDRIDVYEPDVGTSFKSVIGNVAVESYFYDLRYEEEKLSTESWFARVIEGPFWPVLDRLCSHPDAITTLSGEEELILARYVAAQRLRVPRRREYIERTRAQVRQSVAELISNWLKKPVTADEIDEYLPDDDTMPWLRSRRTYQIGEAMSAELGEITGDANMLIAKPWRLGRAHPDHRLYTSDNPVSSHLPAVLPDWWDDFKDAEQFFPLSPNLLLHFGAVPRVEGTISFCGDRRCLDFSKWETSRARAMIAYESTRYVFGPDCTLDRKAARCNVFAFDDASRDLAIELSGYDPSKSQAMPKQIIKLNAPGIPHISGIAG